MTNYFSDKNYQTIIRPNNFRDYWRDVWNYREVLYIFSKRDILVRYKQTSLGLLWTFIKPILSVIVFTIVFSKIANLSSPQMPYPVLVLSGILPWYFFSNTLNDMSNSIINNQSMVSKIFFPRILLPLSTITLGIIDLLISMGLVLVLMLLFGMNISILLFFTPLFLILAGYSCIGLGLFLSALNVKYRDVRIIIPFFLQFGLYISPVGFSSEIVPEKWQLLYSLNPMVGVIEGFRWCISGGETAIYWSGILYAFCISTIMLIFGFRYFRSVEKTFSDVI